MAGPTYYTNQVNTVYKFDYDPLGHKTNEVLGYGSAYAVSNSYVYTNGLDLLVLRDGNGHTTTFLYDAYGRVTDKYDANNHLVFHRQYDAAGRLQTASLPSTIVANSYVTNAYAFDAAGNLTNIAYPNNRNRPAAPSYAEGGGYGTMAG